MIQSLGHHLHVHGVVAVLHLHVSNVGVRVRRADRVLIQTRRRATPVQTLVRKRDRVLLADRVDGRVIVPPAGVRAARIQVTRRRPVANPLALVLHHHTMTVEGGPLN